MNQFPLSLYRAVIEDVDAWRKENPLHTRESLGDVLGVSPRVIYNYLEIYEDDNGNLRPKTALPLDKIPALCRHIRRHKALDILCLECGMIPVRLPEGIQLQAEINQEIARCYREVGEAFVAITADKPEAQAIQREVTEAVQQLIAVMQYRLREGRG